MRYTLSTPVPGGAFRGLVQEMENCNQSNETEAVFFSTGKTTRKPPPNTHSQSPGPLVQNCKIPRESSLDENLSFKTPHSAP
ncbi:hypothetical protein TNCV_3952941 [Trichonephila clavipes]|nr:hypothetical protein TNCV_3952941 [Trichonephila clavipes]